MFIKIVHPNYWSIETMIQEMYEEATQICNHYQVVSINIFYHAHEVVLYAAIEELTGM